MTTNVSQTKWDPENLHRHPDFAPIKKEPTTETLGRQPRLPQLKREWPSDLEEHQHARKDLEWTHFCD